MWGQGRGSTHLGEEAEEAAILHLFVHLRAQGLLVPLGLGELGHHAAGDERDGVVDGGRALGAAGEAEQEEVAEVGAEGGVDVRHALVEHLRRAKNRVFHGGPASWALVERLWRATKAHILRWTGVLGSC